MTIYFSNFNDNLTDKTLNYEDGVREFFQNSKLTTKEK